MNPFEDYENFEEYDDLLSWRNDDAICADTELYEGLKMGDAPDTELWDESYGETTRETYDISEIAGVVSQITFEDYQEITEETRTEIESETIEKDNQISHDDE